MTGTFFSNLLRRAPLQIIPSNPGWFRSLAVYQRILTLNDPGMKMPNPNVLFNVRGYRSVFVNGSIFLLCRGGESA